MRLARTALLVAILSSAAPALAQEPMLECIARYQTTTRVQDDFPGMLGAFKDRPCKHATYLHGVGSRAPGGGLARLEFAERPKHGKISAKSASTFVFLPDKGYTGADTMVIRYHFKGGKTASVRFAITIS